MLYLKFWRALQQNLREPTYHSPLLPTDGRNKREGQIMTLFFF